MGSDRIADIWGTRSPHTSGTSWPQRVDQFLTDGVGEGDVEKWVSSPSERTLGDSFTVVSRGHTGDAEVHFATEHLARQRSAHAAALAPITARFPAPKEPVPERLHAGGLTTVRSGAAGLLRDLQDLYQLVNFVDVTWTLLCQTSQAARDHDLLRVLVAAPQSRPPNSTGRACV